MGISQSAHQQALMMAPVLMYATRHCPYCQRARLLLQHKQVQVHEIDVGYDADLWEQMENVSGRDTVPQIFIYGQHIGGYDDMAALDRVGKLDGLLFNHNSSEGLSS